jgi:NAD(P)-dependent dehydrogenase (short-subunit alcohol dehydrogenase family)
MSIAGKTIFITGAARGIGAESARRAAAQGANVAVVGLEPEELERVASACGDRGAAFQCDVTDADQVKAAVDGTIERFGSIDAVVVNAGIGGGGLMRYTDPDAFEAVIRVNLLGSWRTIKATLPHVIEARGYILQIASVAAIVNAPGMGAYSASKSAVEALANCLRTEVKHTGTDVGVAYFSWIGTDMVHGADDNPVGQRMRQTLRGPAAKTHSPADAAKAVIEGIEQRKRIVVTPSWVRPMLAAKTLVQRLTEKRATPSLMAEIDQITREEIEAHGIASFEASGAGGQAFLEADRQRSGSTSSAR